MSKKNKKKATPRKKQVQNSSPSALDKITGLATSWKEGREVFHKRFWMDHKWAALVLTGLVFALYGQSILYNEYVLDDKIVIAENKYVKSGTKGISDILKHDTFMGFLNSQKDLVEGARYRPLSLVTFAIEHQIFGEYSKETKQYDLSPKVGHFFNVLWYAFTVLLLYRVFCIFIPGKKENPWWFSLPFAAALLFVVHPVHSEAVANIKGRDEVMALCLSLATLYFSLKYIVEEKAWQLVATLGVFFLAILAKENSLTFLAVIPMTIYLFTGAPLRKLATVGGALFGMVLFYLFVRYSVIGYLLNSGKEITSLMNNPFAESTTDQKWGTIFYSLLMYIKLLFVPLKLTHDYYPYQVPKVGMSNPIALLSLLFHLGITALALLWYKKYPVFTWSVITYLATLSIVSNIPFTVGTTMNERFIFMPSVGFCLLVGYWLTQSLPGLLKAQDSGMKRAIPIVVLFLVSGAFGVKTFARVPAWQSNYELNKAAIKVSTNSARCNSFYGYSLYEKALKTEDQEEELALYREALPYVNRALEIHPGYRDALTAKGGIIAGIYKYDRDLDALLQGFYEILQSNHISYSDQYMEYLNRRGQNIDKLTAHYHRTGYELFYQQQNKLGLAIKYLEYGLQVDPSNIQIMKDIVEVYYKAGKYDKVKSIGQQVLSQRPGMAPFSEYAKLVQGK